MTTTFAKEIKRFLRSEEGPTSMEYALMITLVLVAVFASVQLLLVFFVAQQTGCQENNQSANQGDGNNAH